MQSGNVKCVQVVLDALAQRFYHPIVDEYAQNSPCSAEDFSRLFTRKDDNGKTALHIAAALEKEDCLQLLLSYFADHFLDVLDKDAKTVHDGASEACKKFLLSLNSK